MGRATAKFVHRSANLGWVDEVTRDEAEAKAADIYTKRSEPEYAPLPAMPRRSQSAVRLGATAELIAACYLMQHDYEVFRALNAWCHCDLVAIKGDGVPLRIEVKFCGLTEAGTPTVDIRHKRGKFDLLIVVTPSGSVIEMTHEKAESLGLFSNRRTINGQK